jgi:hypothetical protein
VIENVLRNKKGVHFDPKELRNRQIADISEMIKEKRMSSNGTVVLSPKSPSILSAELFNKNRNDSKYLVQAINEQQRSIYNKLMKEKTTDKVHFGVHSVNKINNSLIKDYTANRESTTFEHEVNN